MKLTAETKKLIREEVQATLKTLLSETAWNTTGDILKPVDQFVSQHAEDIKQAGALNFLEEKGLWSYKGDLAQSILKTNPDAGEPGYFEPIKTKEATGLPGSISKISASPAKVDWDAIKYGIANYMDAKAAGDEKKVAGAIKELSAQANNIDEFHQALIQNNPGGIKAAWQKLAGAVKGQKSAATAGAKA